MSERDSTMSDVRSTMSDVRGATSERPTSARTAVLYGTDATAEIALEDPFAGLGGHPPDPARPLTPSGHLRRRQLLSRAIESAQTACAILAVALLAFVLYSVVSRGASQLSIGFLTKDPPLEGQPGGGIGPLIVGTATLVAMAAAMAAPAGILAALYMTEFAGRRAARALRLVLDLLYGVPTIVTGLFVFGLLVVDKGQSGFAGSVALAIVMLPLVARASEEALLLVPRGLHDATHALGVARWRAIAGVVLPAATGGIITGTVLALARAAGETAPLMFSSSVYHDTISTNVFGEATPNIPIYIYKASNSPDPYGFARAWGAAFVLMTFILVVNVLARTILGRRRVKLGH